MSVPALYRVVVRMLYDPGFTRAVYADRASALAGIDLDPAERDWLVAADPRAWRTDRMRRLRSLTGLLEEFPAAGAFALRRGREGVVRLELERLDAFFSHPIFHDCLQRGGSIVFAFGQYLEEGSLGGVAADPRIAPLARLESAIARLRRRRDPHATAGSDRGDARSRLEAAGAGHPPPADAAGVRLRLAPWIDLVDLPSGTSELHSRVSRAMRAKGRPPVASVLDGRWSLPVLLDLDFAVEEPVLLERPPEPGVAGADRGVRQAPVTRELAGLLRAAATGATREELMAVARDLGAETEDEAEIVDGLMAEGLLTPSFPEIASSKP